MANEDRLRGLLGLCQRAGKLQSGADQVMNAIRTGKCALALIDRDAAQNTVKKVTDACIYYHVPHAFAAAGLLGEATGREGRMTAAVLDPGFARSIAQLTETDD